MDRFDVYIADEGLAEIDGKPVGAAPGQSVHEAVLDQLQRYAEERGEAVEATVDDGSGTPFVLEVSPDGSSQVLPPEEPEPAPEPEAPFTETPPAPAPAPTAASAIAVAVARARAAAPPPVLAVDLPAEFTEQVGRINAWAADGRLEEAYVEASVLRASLTDLVGAEHPHAVEARAVEAYLAHLCGDHREAIVLALAVARIRCRTWDGQAEVDVARAAAAWQRLDDDRAAATHGRELLHMWDQLERRGRLSPAHAELAEQVRGQMDELAAAYA
ncbi:hypothetical protein ACIQNU_25145 [Streptomyces sp. NPDC091292]|uniref:hypothetical protein n=1 Tax=Streptomyces sp. NPDC091292 TaxID=3365991 RepID=UPI0037F3AEAC